MKAKRHYDRTGKHPVPRSKDQATVVIYSRTGSPVSDHLEFRRRTCCVGKKVR